MPRGLGCNNFDYRNLENLTTACQRRYAERTQRRVGRTLRHGAHRRSRAFVRRLGSLDRRWGADASRLGEAHPDLVAENSMSNLAQFAPHAAEIASLLGWAAVPDDRAPPQNDPRVKAVVALAPDGDIRSTNTSAAPVRRWSPLPMPTTCPSHPPDAAPAPRPPLAPDSGDCSPPTPPATHPSARTLARTAAQNQAIPPFPFPPCPPHHFMKNIPP